MSNTKRNRHLGGGAEPKNSLFKPIVATSLALTLGVSVAVADPSLQWNNGTAQQDVSLTSANGTTWATSSGTNAGYKQLQVDGSPVENIIMTFVPKTSNTSSTAPVITPNGSIHTRVNGENTTLSGYLIQQGGQAKTGKPEITLTTGSSASAGIMLGANGEGNLYLNFIEISANDFTSKDNNWGGSTIRKMTLDLSQASTTEYSLMGNIVVDSGRAAAIYGENAFEAKFAKGMSGNLTIRENQGNGNYTDIISKIVFLNGSSIRGDINIAVGASSITGHSPYSGNNFIFRKDGSGNVGGIIGTLRTTGGHSRFYYEANDVVISNQTILDIRAGTVIFDAYKNVSTIDSTLTSSGINGNTIKLLLNDSSSISGGNIVFNGYKQVIFGDNGTGTLTIAPKIDGETTYRGGSVKFVIDGATANDTIVKGNILANSGGVTFALSSAPTSGSNPFTNPSAIAPTDTYYVDGNITINNGGALSAFWDDTQGFYGKVATTSGHTLFFDVAQGLVGKNDAWFAKGTFTNGKNKIAKIQNYSTQSHLVFEDAVIIGDESNSINTNVIDSRNKGLQALFKENVTINGGINANSATNDITFNGATSISGGITLNGSGSNNITFNGATNTIGGNITANRRMNKILFKQGDSTIGGNILIDNKASGQEARNYFSFAGTSATLGEATKKISIKVTDSTNDGKGWYSPGNNTFVFDTTTTSLYVSELSLDGDFGKNDTTPKTFNVLSFNSDLGNGSRNIGLISSSRGTNVIGKGLVTTEGVYNTTMFGSDSNAPQVQGGIFAEFIKDTYTAKGNFVFGDNSGESVQNAIVAYAKGNNYINVDGTTSIKGNILISNKKSESGASNYLSLSGTSATLGEATKKISIKIENSTGDGNMYRSYGNNTLLFNTTTSTLYVSQMSVSGDGGTSFNPIPYTFNALSFNNDSDTTGSRNIDTLSSANGSNIIGKNLITQANGYNTTLFGRNLNSPQIQSGFFTEFIKDTYTAKGNFVFGDNSGESVQNAIVAYPSANNYINVDGTTSIKGNILISNKGGAGASNYLSLSGTSATLGEATKKISIKIENSTGDGKYYQSYGNNTLLFNTTTSTLYISQMSVNGDGGSTKPYLKTFNALSFNSDSNSGSRNIDTLSSANGSNIIGKNLITQANGYNTTLFGNDSTAPQFQDGFLAEFKLDTHTAKGSFTFGTITANGGGTNYINAENVAITTSLNASGGNNYIYANSTTGTNTISGDISANAGSTNIITLKATDNTISGNISNNAGTNTIDVGSNNLALGLQDKKISISASGGGTANNSITAGTITAYLASMTATGNWNGNNDNNITASSGSISVDSLEASGGKTSPSNPENIITLTSGNLTFGTISATNNGANIVSFGGTGVVTGNISKSGSGKNNFEFTADNSTLTLQGEDSRVSSITAFSTATNNTLYLDATLNDSVVASVDSITNSNVLKVDFKGINADKSTRLNLNTANVTNLKNVSATSGTNNTLFLSGTGTMTIADAVTIGEGSGDKKGVTFDLTSGSNLTFNDSAGLTTQADGITSFNLGSSTTITGTLSNSGIHNYNIMNATTTFKYATGTSGLTFTSGENNINFQVDGSTLNWQKNDGSGTYSNIDIITNGSGATTNLNFFESGTFANGISTTDGTTNINIYNQKSATISSEIATASGATNVVFKAPTQREAQVTYSTLTLNGATNALTSVTSEANAQAKIALNGTNGATIGTTTIKENATLLFAFTGSGDSTITATSGITVGEKATLGISLGGNGDKKVVANAGASISFATGSTLLVDFQDGNASNGQLGDGTPFTISTGSNSIINFHGTNTGSLTSKNGGNSIIVNGGENTVNFMGGTTAVFAGVTLTSGKNTINVYGADISDNGIKGTVITTDVGSVSNIINLNDYATLDLKSDKGAESGSGSLTSTGGNNASELNFIGTGATLQGGFGATSATAGSATITVGSADKEEVSGVITGAVSNSDLKFEAGNSKLTLKSGENTFKSLTTKATNGVLVLDASSKNISAEINNTITINDKTSLTFGLYSENTNNAKVSVEGLKVKNGGTLGIAIGGSGTGTREVKITSGSGSYADMFDVGSTLRIDFLENADGSATLGNGKPIVIGSGRNSQINFYGGSGNPSLAGGITLDGGRNEVNFYGNATLTGITLKSGDNTIRVKGSEAGITGIVGVSSVGSVRNTVELERNATLSLTNGSDVGTLSNASVNVLGTSTKIAGTITNASIAFKSADADLTLQAGDSTITSLTGYTAPSTYTRNGRTITRTISNTLTLDDTDDANAISATMLNAITSDNVALKFGSGNEAKTFTLQASGNTFQGVEFEDDSTNNTLEFNGTSNTITGAINIATDNNLTIKLAKTTANSNVSLNLAGGLSNADGGTANIIIEGSQINATLSGEEINANTLTFANNTSLSVSNAGNNTFASVDASKTGTLIANDSALTITALTGDKLTAGFSGNGISSVKIINDNDSTKSITLAGVVLNGATSDNTLDLTTLTGTTISSKVSVGANQALSINLGETTLNLSEGLETQGSSTIDVKNDLSATLTGKAVSLTTLSLGNSSSSMTLKNSQSTINSVSGDGTLKVDASSNAVLTTISGNLEGNSLTINLKGTSAQNSATLQLDGASNDINALSFEASSSNNKVILNGNTTIATKVTDNTSATFDLNSSALTLSSGMDVTGGTTTFNLSGTSAINGALALNNGNVNMNLSGNSTFTLANNPTRTNSEKLNFAFKGSNATLNVDANKLSLDTLTSSGSNTIDLVIDEESRTTSNTTFKLLDIGSMNGGSVKTTLFVNKDTSISNQTLGDVSANGNGADNTYGYAYSDRVVVKAGTNSSNIVLSVVPNLDQLLDLTYSGSNGTGDSGNIALATVKKDSGVQVSAESVTIGFDVVEAQLQEVVTDVKGNASEDGDYLTYFLGGAVSKGASVETQEVAQSALAVSYDLYLANFNSLNKRMGELRDNNHDNGVWARVFGGAISNDFGAGSKTQYVTTQAGYDYSLSVGDNARNYIGIAVAYGHSSTQSNTLTQSGSVFGSTQTIGLDKVSSDMVEVGLYNSYVADSGWYNDTIFKFDYIMSEFALSNDLSKMTKTNNFAMILSDEFGYRYSFGVSEKGSWYIDPQAEVGFGWFNQSDFNRSLESSLGTSTLKATQDAILTLRTRVGASLGKKFNTDKGFASVYVGAFYEYDYIEGGNTEVTSGNASSATTNNFLQQIESNGRAILNVGSNIELTKGARLYIDVEKSFGDKQRTFMQFNLGARYSF